MIVNLFSYFISDARLSQNPLSASNPREPECKNRFSEGLPEKVWKHFQNYSMASTMLRIIQADTPRGRISHTVLQEGKLRAPYYFFLLLCCAHHDDGDSLG